MWPLPDQETAEIIARLAAGLGSRTEVVYNDREEDEEEDDSWDGLCTKTMLATYDGVLEAQRQLDELSRPFGGATDGWGTLGTSAGP